jgi:hypothetical protein
MVFDELIESFNQYTIHASGISNLYIEDILKVLLNLNLKISKDL